MEGGAEESARNAEVLAIVSHDIRAPLGVILAAVSELLDPRVGSLTDEQRALVQLVRRSSERLTRLAANVFFLKRASGVDLALARQPVDLRDVARRAIDSFERSGEIGKALRVVLHVPGERVEVKAEAELLVHAVTNVLANAIRVARSEIVVTVEMGGVGPAVVVDDDGPGIPASLAPVLFDSGARLRPGQGRQPRGLGLLIVKGIVDAHGANVSARNRVDERDRPVGATVRIGFD